MKKKDQENNILKNKSSKKDKSKNPESFTHPVNVDIYNQGHEETEIDPEQITRKKAPNEKKGTKNEKGFEDDMSGDDLDVPGSELDDEQEDIGSEDEENNYYSIGGDNHSNLDENKGE